MEMEKTIPFLRQLTEMLQNNEELISFVPGQRLPNETICGKIVVHDRGRVQGEVLPIYFNHASFASLRRQLSYFSFVRVGKSRQAGVTYTNDNVIELSDILKLKRRAVGKAAAQQQQQSPAAVKKANEMSRRQQKQNNNRCQQVKMLVLPTQQQRRLRQAEEQKQQQEQLSADVASAVLSGALHAAKTNDIMGKDPYTTDTTLRVGHNGSANATQWQAESSMSQSASTSSGPCSNSKNSKSKNFKAPKPKVHHRKKRRKRSYPKSKGKDRARLNKLLSLNSVVPFIHLPAGQQKSLPGELGVSSSLSKRSSNKKCSNNGGTSSTEMMSSKSPGSGSRAGGNPDARVRVIQTKFHKTSSSASAAVAAAMEHGCSKSAIDALLALGEERQ